MADILKPAFRATSGLDAAGEKVINVAKADRSILSDGVNVEFFIEENTLQQYDPTRGYKKDFAVIYDNRVWVAEADTPVPAGAFAEIHWKAVRTDPKWYTVKVPTYTASSGDYLTVDSSLASGIAITLPNAPIDGDTIVIKDIGGKVHLNKLNIISSNQLIVRNGQAVSETLITKPYAYNILIYSNAQWQFWEAQTEERGTRVEPTSGEYQAASGDNIMLRFTLAQAITVRLPKYANHGDIIKVVDIDSLGSMYHLITKTFDNTTSIGKIGDRILESRSIGDGFYVYNANDKLWVHWNGDLRTRLRPVRGDTDILPNESVIVFGDNNMTPQTITLKLPTNVANGDIVKIALNYIRKQQTIIIKAAGTDKIATDINLLQFPKRSEYPPDMEWVLESQLEFNGDISYTPVIELSYMEDTNGKKYWVVAQNVPTVERVDPKDNNTRKRVGVISLASVTEAQVDLEGNPNKEAAITPETLAKRVATEEIRGIARIATQQQVNQNTDFAFTNDVIITPKRLNERTATETRRGVAEIATQTEVFDGIDDTTIITPKKLEARQASESMSGITKLVSTTSTVPAVSRDVPGTNVYNYNDGVKVITPKSLNQNKSTYTSQGGVFLATQAEVIEGTQHTVDKPTVVTPVELHKKTAQEDRIGFTEIATQLETDTGTDDFRYITPLKLNNRKASQTLSGIARIATQIEFGEGLLDTVISTPLKVKTYFDDVNRVTVDIDSGLIQSGTLWNHYTLNISEAKETQRGTLKLATQPLVDAGVDDKTAVTPLKLQKKKATEGTEGIVQIATQAEVIAATAASATKAVPPIHLKHVIQTEKTWEATSARRGTVRLTTGTATWDGDDVKGSVEKLGTFEDAGFAISPLQMNTALSHYLPKGAKAVDSDLLDGLDSLQFIRRDIDQTVGGKLTLTKETIVQAPITSTSSASFTGDVSVNRLKTKTGIDIQNGTNTWTINAALDATSLVFGADILTLNSSNGNIAVKNNVTAGNDVHAKKNFVLADKIIATTDGTTSVSLGTVERKTIINTSDASNLMVNDGTAYRILTEKNAVELVGGNFVKKIGDVMSGDLTVHASVKAIRVAPASPDTAPTASTLGFWSADINTAPLYNLYPGNWTRKPNGERDQEIKGPGTLSQFGNSLENVYQDWVTHPIGENIGSIRYTRVWQDNKKTWSTWSMVFTYTNPPTATDVGAVPSEDAVFTNLTIQDWLQIGKVRMVADEATQTVKFVWVG